MDEYEYEIEQIKKLGIKGSALRLEYEEKVRALKTLPQKLRAEGQHRAAAQARQNRRDRLGHACFAFQPRPMLIWPTL